MTTTRQSNVTLMFSEWGGGKAPRDVPLLLSLVEQTPRERPTYSHVPEIALHLIRKVEQRLPLVVASPVYESARASEAGTFADQVQASVMMYLQQGFQRLVLVPWGSKQRADSLIEPVMKALSIMTGEAVCRTEMALPQVHVDGISVRTALEGLASIQTQLGPLVAAFPGWGRTWIRLSAGEVKIVLPCIESWTEQQSQAAARKRATLKALTAVLCPHQMEGMTANECSRWQQDGAIYAHYLVALLCAATALLQKDQV